MIEKSHPCFLLIFFFLTFLFIGNQYSVRERRNGSSHSDSSLGQMASFTSLEVRQGTSDHRLRVSGGVGAVPMVSHCI